MPERLRIPTKATVVRSCLAMLSGALACIAIVLTLNDPEITYSSDISEAAQDIQVSCTDDVSDGASNDTRALANAPLLDAGLVRGRYEVIRGEDALDRVSDEASGRDAQPNQVMRSINADCAHARTNRTNAALRVTGGAIIISLLALLSPVLLHLRRQPKRSEQ